VAVALSGDGGDELFVGYNWYSWVFRQQVWQERAGMLSNLATRGSRLLPSRTPGRRFLASLGLDASHQFFERVVLVPSWVKSVVYGPDLVEALSGKEYADVFMDLFNSMEGDILQKMSLTDLHSYLPEDILTKVDRASMAVSLETRTPWLDYRLVEFAFSLPSEWKLRNGQKKYLPKLLAQRLLPENLPLDRKHGFNIPLQEWMRGSLGTLLEENLRNPALSRYLNPIKVTKLLQRHRESYGARHGAALFAILVFGLWSERYLTD
jgi:asparagine synthase (glutamine-hydrolysing)